MTLQWFSNKHFQSLHEHLVLKKLGSKQVSFHVFSIVLWFQPVKNNLRSTWAYSPNILKHTAISWDDGPVYHMHGGKALAVHQITSDSNGIHASKARNGENMVCFKCVSRQATKQRGNIKIWKFPKCSCKPQVPVQNESVMYSRWQHFSSFS